MYFAPFELNDDSSFLSLPYSDPDQNFFNHNEYCINSNYYLESSFNKMCHDKYRDFYGLSLFHLNIRSLPKNLNNLELYFKNLNMTFSVIGLSETWIQESNVLISGIDGYKCEHVYREKKTGGGVSLFVKNSIDYTKRDDLIMLNDSIETVFIEVEANILKTLNNVIIGVIYRPPNSDINSFMSDLKCILSKLDKEKKCIYVMGDFNLNLLNMDNHLPTSEFLEIMYSFSYFPLINKPTRIKKDSATLIDNIFCNTFSKDIVVDSGIFFTDISDHFPIFSINSYGKSSDSVRYVRKRIFNNTNIQKFVNQISMINWDDVLHCQDAQEAFTKLYNHITHCFNVCFPLVKVKLNYRNRKQWLSTGLKESIKNKNKLYVKSVKFPTLFNINKYKEYRNKLHSILRRAERDYYDQLLTFNKNNLAKSWKILKEVINKNNNVTMSNKFNINNEVVTDNLRIAEGFNNFYVNVGLNLAKDIPIIDKDPTEYITKQYSHSLFLEPVVADEMKSIILNLKESSSGYDDVSAKIVKSISHIIIEPLTHSLNLSFSHGVFPNELKIAKVIPLYKSKDKMLFCNYRPVSILPLFSKIYERIMYNRIIKFITKNNILYKYQFGFRKNHGTNVALFYMFDKIIKSLEEGQIVMGLFLDFRKAFNTVNHQILLKKMYKYGIRGVVYDWFKSYLSNRKQYVNINKVNSPKLNITCGIPQGSILGPLMFLLYINDIANVSSVLFFLLFADDTTVFCSGKNIDDLINIVNREMQKLIIWLYVNKLSINTEKTNYILFSLRKKINTSCNVYINQKVIDRVTNTKFLGVIIDEKLTWSHHIKYIKKKISKGIGIICKARKIFKMQTLLTMYYSFIYPYFVYCLEFWGSASNYLLDSLFKLQKRAIRLIVSAGFRAHTEPIFLQLNLLPLSKLHQMNIIMFMYKFKNSILPDIFHDVFQWNKDIHQYNTRQSDKLHVVKCKTSTFIKSPSYRGILLWNYIVNILNVDCNIQTFKWHLKTYLLNNTINI